MGGAGTPAMRDAALEPARAAFARRAWREAYARLAAADLETALDADDLERLALAAYLTGQDEASDDAWARAHEALLADDDEAGAARCAFWLGFSLILRAEMARGAGWFSRAQRLVDEHAPDCAVAGYLLVPRALETLDSGDASAAFALFAEAGVIGERCRDADLVNLGRLGRGQALIAQGEITAGVGLLDEAMVAVTAGEVTPFVAGIVYCAVLLECHQVFDVRRAREWTAALNAWCEAQPDLVPYRGQCLVHRAEVLQVGGHWPDALDAARRACERLAGHPAIGDAYYQQAELHRLRGDVGAAEDGYRSASRFGREPQPGLALLRLAQGKVDAAASSSRRVLDEAVDQAARSRVLPAHTEIMLAAGDVGAARAAADELAAIARDHAVPMLSALAGQAQGAVLLAEGDPRGALDALRASGEGWRAIEAPYDAARVRALIGLACRELGDEDAAGLELEAACAVLEELGAEPDLTRIDALGRGTRSLPNGLTAREAEVLALVAAGQTNREIAETLVISDHTVRRHLQNIFAKIGVRTRASATAFAFQHDLV